MADGIDQEGRTAFVTTLPRKVAELRAALGTLVADPKSQRMRDELRRRLHAVYTLTRSYNLPTLSEGLREGIAHLDALRGAAVLTQRDLEMLADLVSTLPALAQRDLPDRPDLFPATRGRARASASPEGADSDAASTVDFGSSGASSAVGLGRPGTEAPPPSKGPVPRTTMPQFTAVQLPPEATGQPSLPRRVSSEPPANTGAAPLGVLVVGSATLVEDVKRALPSEAEVSGVRTLADAVTAARDMAPDVVVAECAPPGDGLGLLAALRGDPLTDFLPVVLLATPSEGIDAEGARNQGAAELLALPITSESLRGAVDRAAQGLSQPSLPPPDFNGVTLEELTQTLQDEIRRGILGAAGPRSGHTRVSLGQGSEVLAATWEAIARVREIVEKKTRGRVRFEMPGAQMGLGGAHVLSIGDDEELPPEDLAATDDPLPGRVALVVDDDPGVVWFFAGLLRDAKMEVTECTDGVQALKDARRVRPDVVISDILMPGLDGFALCRAIRRDVSLRHTPVILLSWKEDLLVRMRELGAQAQGFLRKESRGDAVLARVRAVLRPRVRMLHRIEALAEGAELRGRVERTGVFALLESAGRALRDATVVITDSYSVSELELRDGRLASVLRTAQDGSLARGEGALLQVLGVTTGRFAVKRAQVAVRPNLQGDLTGLLAGGAALISALEDALSGAALLEVVSIDLDGESALSYARSLPETMRTLVERIVSGESPRNLVLRDGIAPQELEPVLVELARRGAIRSVRGAEGEDLVAPRYAASRAGESLRPSELASIAPGRVSQTLPAVLDLPTITNSAASAATPRPEGSGTGPDRVEMLKALQEISREVTRPSQPGGERPSLAGGERRWSPPTNFDEAARPGFGLESEAEADSLAGAVLRELRAPYEPDETPAPAVKPAAVDAPDRPAVMPVPPAGPVLDADADEGPMVSLAVPSSSDDTAETAETGRESTEPLELEPEPAMPPADEGPALEATPAEPEAPAEATPASVPPLPLAPGRRSSHLTHAREEAEASLTYDELATDSSPVRLDLDAFGMPRRRSVPELPELQGPEFEPHAPTRPAPRTGGSESVIVDPTLVGSDGAPRDVPTPATPVVKTTPPPTAKAPVTKPAEADGGRSNLWLVVAFFALGALSFVAVRYYLARTRHEAPSPQVSGDEPPAVAADAAMSDAAAAATTENDAGAVSEADALTASGTDGAVALSSPPLGATSQAPADAAALYVDPERFLDGGTLAPDRGLVRIEAPGRTGVLVVVARRPIGQAPVTLQLPRGLYEARGVRNGVTVYSWFTVRPGRALRVELPAEP